MGSIWTATDAADSSGRRTAAPSRRALQFLARSEAATPVRGGALGTDPRRHAASAQDDRIRRRVTEPRGRCFRFLTETEAPVTDQDLQHRIPDHAYPICVPQAPPPGPPSTPLAIPPHPTP